MSEHSAIDCEKSEATKKRQLDLHGNHVPEAAEVKKRPPGRPREPKDRVPDEAVLVGEGKQIMEDVKVERPRRCCVSEEAFAAVLRRIAELESRVEGLVMMAMTMTMTVMMMAMMMVMMMMMMLLTMMTTILTRSMTMMMTTHALFGTRSAVTT